MSERARAPRWLRCVLLLLLLACCSSTTDDAPAPPTSPEAVPTAAPDTPYEWNLPPGFPLPALPEDNPMSVAKVELGRHLFYDERLSVSGNYSCGTCHQPALAFSDGRAHGLGATGQEHPRGSMSLANVAYAASLTWAHPLLGALERQAELPMFGDTPIELGLRSREELEQRLAEEPLYPQLFGAAFPGEPAPLTLANACRAIASFERTLISGRSSFDRWLMEGDESAISEGAKRGFALFNTETFECYHCHGGFAFTDHVTFAEQAFSQQLYHNTGLYNLDGRGAFPEPNTGVESITENPADMGRFKAPTLRNIAVTAPYMHDGSIATLSEVLDHYAAGGRTIPDGPNAGIGSASPLKSNFVRGFRMTEDERRDFLEFLDSLTDPTFLHDPATADPWR